MSVPLVVLYAAGLTTALLPRLPRIAAVGARGFGAPVGAVLPAAAGPAQSTFLTGLRPREHGVVGAGWYERDLGEILVRPRYRGLVHGEPLWATVRRTRLGYRVANLGWEYALGAGTDLTVSPGPNGPGDCYTTPPVLLDRLQAEFGPFPGLEATTWIGGAARHILETDAPDLTLVALPHLDDTAAGAVIAAAERRGATVVVLSAGESARSVDVNGLLRREGLLTLATRDGTEQLDPWASRAFAVEGGGVAHVYVRDPADLPRVGGLLGTLPGVEVLDAEGKRAHALDHPRSGELVVLAPAPHDAVLLCSDPALQQPGDARVAATQVRDLLLEAVHLPASSSA